MENIQIEQPEALDIILKYLVSKKGEWQTIHQIHDAVFKDQDKAIVNYLLKHIISSNQNLVQYSTGEGYGDLDIYISMCGTAITEQFLKRGGYTKEYAEIAKIKAESQENKALEKQVKIDQIHTNEVVRKWNIINTVISILAFGLALAAFLWKKH